MKVILIGRHTSGDIPDIEVVEQKNVTFPATAEGCTDMLLGLFAEADAQSAGVLFQSMPGQVAVALCALSLVRGFKNDEEVGFPRRAVGVIISVPGPRPGRVSQTFWSDDPHADYVGLAKFANPRAETEGDPLHGVTVTVDGPPAPFVFSHIEWLD